MPTLLHVDSSPLYGMSVSRELTAAFVAEWRAKYPDGKVITRDLNATPLKPLTLAWVGAMATPADARTPEQKAELALSEELLAELREADQYVIGAPLYNFSVAADLKMWVDQITRAGETFSYVDGAPKGLLTGKKTVFIVSSGGNYEPGTPLAHMSHVQPWLSTIFSFLGVTDQSFVAAGGTSALRYGADRSTLLAPHHEKTRAAVAAF